MTRTVKRQAGWTGRAARVVAAGALAFSMGGGATLVGAAAAMADDGVAGSVTIYKSAGDHVNATTRDGHSTAENHDVTYDAYRVFTGTVASKEQAQETGSTDEWQANRISDVAWNGDTVGSGNTYTAGAMHTAVLGAIQKWDPSYEDPADEYESAQKAAEFIANHIGSDGDPVTGKPNQDFGLYLESQQFGSVLAGALKNDSAVKADRTGIEADKTYGDFADGWYLFVTTPASLSDEGSESSAGTAPIFAVVGGDPVELVEKASVPTVDKKVLDDSRNKDVSEGGSDATTADDWGMAADANANQEVWYMLTGTVANDIGSFDDYQYKFTDTADAGISHYAKADGTADGLRVYLHKAHYSDYQRPTGTKSGDSVQADPSASEFDRSIDVTGNFETKVEVEDGKSTLTVGTKAKGKDDTYGGLRNLDVGGETYRMAAGDYLTVVYKAHIDPNQDAKDDVQGTDRGTNVVQGKTGNANEVKVTYSDDPKLGTTQTTYGQGAKLYTYSLRLHKQDRQNAGRSLKGAKFTLMAKTADDTLSTGRYVQADGSLGDEKHEFTTDADGNILIGNLDAGTYTLVETVAPPTGPDGNTDNTADAYEKLDPMDITIGDNTEAMKTDEASNQALQLSATLSQTRGFGHSSDALVADTATTADARNDGSSQAAADGTGVHVSPTSGLGNVNVVIRESKETQMPLTGGAGIAAFAVAGGVVIALGAALMRRRRREDAEADEA